MNKYSVLLVSLFLTLAPALALAAGSDPAPSDADDVRMARTAINDGDFAKAEGLLEKAVADNPQSADAWNYLGYVSRKLGKLREAEGFYDKALALDAEHVGALEYLGILYVKTGRVDEARKLLARIDAACLFTCDEYEDLKEAIETGKTE